MTLPQKSRLFWKNTVASIPANWARKTAYDGRFINGGYREYDGVTGELQGGVTTHTHDVASHNHTAPTHTHPVTGAAATGESTAIHGAGSAVSGVKVGHTHPSGVSSPVADVYNAFAATTSAVASEPKPQFLRVIVIGPDDGLQNIPDGALCFTDEASPPTGFVLDADMVDRFLHGAETGADAGPTAVTGGADTHTHVGGAHEHTGRRHSHSSDAGGESGVSQTVGGPTGSASATPISAHHDLDLTGISSPFPKSGSTAPTLAAGSSEPPFTTLLGIHADGGGTTPVGVIVGFEGAISEIPDDFVLCDGDGVEQTLGLHIKGTNTAGEIGDTGGVEKHGHNADHSHTPTATHTHTGVNQVDSPSTDPFPGGVSQSHTFTSVHSHVWTIGAVTSPTTDVTVITSTTNVHAYLWRHLLWIKRRDNVSTVNILGNTNLLAGNIK